MLQQTFARSLQAVARHSRCLGAAKPPQSSPFLASTFRVAPAASASQNNAARRWKSSQPESEAKQEEVSRENMEGFENTTAKETAEEDAAKDNSLADELETKKKENLDLTDRLKRQVAEYRNLQEQTKREVQAAKDFALQKFAKDLLEIVDNFERALENVALKKLQGPDANQDLVDLHSGLTMTNEILMKILKKHGMEVFDPSVDGEVFNPNQHEATFQAPQPDKENGTVFCTQQKGVLYNGRVLRPAKVGVVKNA